MERKFLDFTFETKAVDEETGEFEGYASIFGEKDSKSDVVMPGAFKRSIAAGGRNKTGILMLWQHLASEGPIGQWLSLSEDSRGLKVHGKLFLTVPTGAKAFQLLKLKALQHLSIGFDILDHSFSKDRKTRYLKSLDLWEISLVSFPALRSARVKIKSEGDLQSELLRLGLAESDAQHIPSLCTSCTSTGGLCAEDIKAIGERLKGYQPDLIGDVVATCEEFVCGKDRTCEVNWADVARSVKTLANEVSELERKAKEDLESLTKTVSSRLESNRASEAIEDLFRVIDKANLKISRAEQKSNEGILQVDMSKPFSDITGRIDHLTKRVSERYTTASDAQEEEIPQRKPRTALENYEHCGVFKAEFNPDELNENLDYLNTKVTHGSRHLAGGSRAYACHTGRSVVIEYPGGPAN